MSFYCPVMDEAKNQESLTETTQLSPFSIFAADG